MPKRRQISTRDGRRKLYTQGHQFEISLDLPTQMEGCSGMIYQEPFVYTDPQSGFPLAGGTAIEDCTSLSSHQGIIAYLYGDQVVIENSFRYRHAVVIPAVQFNGGKTASIVRTPNDQWQGEQIVQRAYADVVAEVTWTPFNNCQDLVTRAYEGKNGSKTRNIVLGGLAAVAVIASL